ncbi:hypothetical protein HDU98_010870 [Podochytrium sp. JEL0797]|nr:hypothetical protein HDU98_010870 [Podochytrium sp. JEL0797]
MHNPLRKLSAASVTATAVPEKPADEVSFSMRPEDYELGNPIGYGSSAMVYIAKYLPMNKIVAVKVIDLDWFDRSQIDELRREIQIMSLSRHPNLLPVYGSFVNGAKLFIVTPFLSAGSLLDIMKTAYPHGIDEQCIGTILKQALQGLEYLHKNGLIHRDVKAGNLLMDDDGLVQLADFGVSSSLMETGERKGNRKTFVGTPCWMAPEVMEQSGYDYKADIWSFGITAMELATGHAPFAKYPPLKVMMMTLQNDPPTLDREQTFHKYSKSFKDLIDACLQKDPNKRPTAEKLLQLPFFKLAVKKRNHLAVDLLQALPPITRRAHIKKTAPEFNQDVRGATWDFSSSSETESSPDGSKTFGDLLPPVVETPAPPPVPYRPGMSQTNVVFKPSPLTASDAAESPISPQTEAAPALPAGESPQVGVVTPSAEIKKGRFSVTEQQQKERQQEQQQQHHGLGIEVTTGSSLVSPILPLDGKPRFPTNTVQSDSSTSSSPQTSVGASSPRASRFTVTNDHLPAAVPMVPMGSTSSNDKRSRFEVNATQEGQHASDSASSPSGSLTRRPAHLDSAPLLSSTDPRHTNSATSTRNNSNTMSSTESNVLHDRLDTIQRQNGEQQKLLNDLIKMMASSGLGVPVAAAAGGVPGVAPVDTLRAIQQQMQSQQQGSVAQSENSDSRVHTLLQENRELKEENMTLRLRQTALETKLEDVLAQFESMKKP